MKRTVNIIKNILLAFVLISIGFALGKNFSHQSSKDESSENYRYPQSNSYIETYYFHSTFRCSTCNKIEKMTKKLLQEKYSSFINSGKIIFTEIDFQTDEELAVKYGIVASCVVVVIKETNKIVEYQRLDNVWTLIDNPEEFNKYISETINVYLDKIKE